MEQQVKKDVYGEVESKVAVGLAKIGMFNASESNGIDRIEGTTKIVPMKKFNLKNKLGKRESIVVRDSTDLSNLETINNIQLITERGDLAICYHLSKLDNEETLSRLGLKSITDIGYGFFDISRTTCTQYARIGRYFVAYNEDEGYHFKSKVLPPSLTKGHLIEFLSFVGKRLDKGNTLESAIQEIEDLYIDGVLTDNISTKELRKRLKQKESEVVVKGEVTEDAKGGEVTEDAKGGEVTEDAKGGEVTEDAKGGEVTEDAKGGEVTEDTMQQVVTDALYAIDAIEANFLKLTKEFEKRGIVLDMASIASNLKDAFGKLLN